MPSESFTGPEPLAQAGQALRQVLLRLDQWAKKRVANLDSSAPYAAAAMQHIADLDALMLAVQQYEQIVLDSLATSSSGATFDPTTLTPAELLARREAEPLYRLGFVRGYRRGVEQVSEAPDQVLRLYAQHAALPPPATAPPTYEALVQRVRRFLAELTQRYGPGPIPRHQPPARYHGTI